MLPRITTLVTAILLAAQVSATEPLIVGHRGLLRHAPENTVANFRACLELRIGFEFDVHRTKDGHLVCIHDEKVDRTTNGTGSVAELTLDEIRKLDAGTWFDPKFAGEKVPTIEEVLKLVAEHRERKLLMAVDLKAADVGEDVARMAQRHKVLERLIFIGTTISDPKVRDRIKAVTATAQTAAVANNAGEFKDALEAKNTDWVYVRYLPSQDEVSSVHAAGKRVFIAGATVSGELPENWKQAADAGVDAILTDFSLELDSVLRQRREGK